MNIIKQFNRMIYTDNVFILNNYPAVLMTRIDRYYVPLGLLSYIERTIHLCEQITQLGLVFEINSRKQKRIYQGRIGQNITWFYICMGRVHCLLMGRGYDILP